MTLEERVDRLITYYNSLMRKVENDFGDNETLDSLKKVEKEIESLLIQN